MENYINHKEYYERTGSNGYDLSTCMNAKLSEMCDNPKIIEDAQWLLDDLHSTAVYLANRVNTLNILLEYYELKEMKIKRKEIIANSNVPLIGKKSNLYADVIVDEETGQRTVSIERD